MSARRIFWLLLALTIAVSFHYRQAGLDIVNLSYKFSRLYSTKKFVAELRVNNDLILVYAEPVKNKPLKINHLEQLQPLIKKAYRDHAIFLERYYQEIIIEHPEATSTINDKKILTIIFVSPDTYESLSRIKQKDSAGYIGFFDTIYLKTYGGTYDIVWLKRIIRHEIFHFLNNRREIESIFFEEAAAERFGDMQ